MRKKESHRRRIKGTKCFDIRANYLAWKKGERKTRPGRAWRSFAPSWAHHPLRDHPLPTPLTSKMRWDLGVLPNTQTWIHLMSSITNHCPTFHYISYCYCQVVIICQEKARKLSSRAHNVSCTG